MQLYGSVNRFGAQSSIYEKLASRWKPPQFVKPLKSSKAFSKLSRKHSFEEADIDLSLRNSQRASSKLGIKPSFEEADAKCSLLDQPYRKSILLTGSSRRPKEKRKISFSEDCFNGN